MLARRVRFPRQILRPGHALSRAPAAAISHFAPGENGQGGILFRKQDRREFFFLSGSRGSKKDAKDGENGVAESKEDVAAEKSQSTTSGLEANGEKDEKPPEKANWKRLAQLAGGAEDADRDGNRGADCGGGGDDVGAVHVWVCDRPGGGGRSCIFYSYF